MDITNSTISSNYIDLEILLKVYLYQTRARAWLNSYGYNIIETLEEKMLKVQIYEFLECIDTGTGGYY